MAPKRKNAPTQATQGRQPKRNKIWDARTIRTQTADAAYSNGELNVDKFVKARAFEIKALEDGIRKARNALSTRAHQELPRELRRRTASHNVKRVPKRLRERARKEMVEDNTPTVTSRRRKISGHQRLRLETAQRLQAISKKSKERRAAKKAARAESEIQVIPEAEFDVAKASEVQTSTKQAIQTKKPKTSKSKLRQPAVPPAKFRKRQIHKTWLPTHLWHSKRARMTPPKEPMWRFALPLTPNIKSYRNAHRASTEKGAIAWDMSYMSTIGLEGVQESIEGLLKALGVSNWDKSGAKWRKGTRVWEGWVHERDAPHTWIAPVMVLWNPRGNAAGPPPRETAKKSKRKAFIRVHPSAFFQLWEQIIRLAKVQKPAITVEDLRWEIGSIEITGPDASEALVGILRPLGVLDKTNGSLTAEEMTWTKLARCSPASLPANAVIAMSITDPRLQFPPQTLPKSELLADDPMLIQLLGNWPLDRTPHQAGVFDHKVRMKAKRGMPTQKAINRRKGQADPGEFPPVLPSDPPIPVLTFSTRPRPHSDDAGTWTVLLPWACVSAVWKSLVYYPLSTGGTIRFGGVNEKKQLALEAETAWFPADCPGTKAGQQWEFEESNRRKAAWDRKPKSRRLNYESLDLGQGRKAHIGIEDLGPTRKGELGVGWMCDWQRLFQESEPVVPEDVAMEDVAQKVDQTEQQSAETGHPQPNGATSSSSADAATQSPRTMHRVSVEVASRLLLFGSKIKLPPNALATIRITMLGRGRPFDCARIYRLPTNNADLRKKWLAQQPFEKHKKSQKKRAKIPPKPAADAPDAVQRAWLAAAILTKKPDLAEMDHPDVPDEEDLIGFVTTGNFSLKDGGGAGIGSVRLDRIIPEEVGWQTGRGKQEERRLRCLCIVRNAGESHGRLAEWDFV